MTVAHVYTVAFQGIEAREVDVQVHIGEGGSGGIFNIVGLADKAVGESRERVRAALSAIGLALPYQRITVNLAPADLPKEGSHYDLPIALGLLAAMGVLPASEIAGYVALGELSLGDQRIVLLARAMVKKPKLLILDEPCQGLDTAHRQAVLETLDRVIPRTGATLIFVTHHAGEMPRCVRRVLHLRAGRVTNKPHA